MDYLDKSKQVRQSVLLWLGYILIAVAIVIATLVLVYQAYGFNVGKDGSVVQNGLVFFSSHPNPANIYLNNKLRSEKTNSRLIIPSGVYKVKITRNGYKDWDRNIVVNGGTVEHFDYPFLFPKILTSKVVSTLQSTPSFAAQSLDRRWLITPDSSSPDTFNLFDLKDPAKINDTALALPSGVVSSDSSGESWQFITWADDNVHLLLNHIFGGKNEYILLNKNDPAQSVNLTSNLGLPSGTLLFNNKKFNSYEFLDSQGNLKLYSLNNQAYQLIDQHVLTYKSYGRSTFLIANSPDPKTNKVPIKLINSSVTYPITHLPLSSKYLIDLTTYSSTLYVAVGSSNLNKVAIYEDPIGQITTNPKTEPVPIWALHVNGANFLSFSKNAQFILAENGQSFAVYDIENDLGYLYNLSSALDPPQTNISWMDGDRITYVAGTKLAISDYDNRNNVILSSASANYLPFFSSNFKYVYTLSNNNQNQVNLIQTPLLTNNDL